MTRPPKRQPRRPPPTPQRRQRPCWRRRGPQPRPRRSDLHSSVRSTRRTMRPMDRGAGGGGREEEQVVEWAFMRAGLLQGWGGHVIMGLLGLPVSLRVLHFIYYLGWLVAWWRLSWHRASLPHTSAGKLFYTRNRSLLPLCLSHFSNDVVQRWF